MIIIFLDINKKFFKKDFKKIYKNINEKIYTSK